jgi:hypothetical protein
MKTGVRVLTKPNKFNLRYPIVSYRTLLETNCSEGIYCSRLETANTGIILSRNIRITTYFNDLNTVSFTYNTSHVLFYVKYWL